MIYSHVNCDFCNSVFSNSVCWQQCFAIEHDVLFVCVFRKSLFKKQNKNKIKKQIKNNIIVIVCSVILFLKMKIKIKLKKQNENNIVFCNFIIKIENKNKIKKLSNRQLIKKNMKHYI